MRSGGGEYGGVGVESWDVGGGGGTPENEDWRRGGLKGELHSQN